MSSITVSDLPRVHTKETDSLDLSEYGKQFFQMFHGEKQPVRLRFENALSGVVIDRFGKDVMLVPDGSEHFTLSAQIRVSPVFLGWLLSFGDRVRILSPQSVIEQYLSLCAKVTAQYPQA